jgi:hypothetical protein
VLRRLGAALLLLFHTASPAVAYLVEVTTSVAVSDADDRRVLQEALLAAVDGVLKQAIAFTPTLIRPHERDGRRGPPVRSPAGSGPGR